MSDDPNTKPLATRVVTNSAVQIVGVFGSSLISLVTFAAVTRYLGPTGFGEYSAALALLLIPSIISDLGLSTTVLRDISRRPELTGHVVSVSLTTRALVSIFVFPITLAIAFVLPLPHATRMAALLATAGAFLLVLNGGLLTVLQAELRMRWATLANIAGRALTLGLTILALDVGGGLYGVILAYVAGNALTLLINFFAVQRRVALKPVLDLRYSRELARGSLIVGAALMMGSLYFRIDTVLLAALRPSSDVGLYSSAYKFLDLSLLVGGAVIISVFPHLSRAIARDELSAAQVQHMFNALLALGTGISVVVLMHAEHLIVLTSGPKYIPATAALRILAPAIVVGFIATLLNGMLFAGDRERLVLLVSGTVFFLNIALNLTLIPLYGYKAAAATTLASNVAWLSLAVVAARRSFGLVLSLSFAPQVAIAAAIMAAVLAFSPGPWPLVEIEAAVAFVFALGVLPGPGWSYILGLLEPVIGRRGSLRDRKSVIT